MPAKRRKIMFKLKNSLVAVAGLSLVTGLIALMALITPTRTHGQGQGGNQQPLNVNVVNAPTVRVTDLYPAEPFQKNLTVPSTGEGVCVSIPEDRGLIIELVTARTTSSSGLATFVRALTLPF